MVMGRPREWDREKLGNELIEWAMLEDSINVNAFCALKLLPTSKISEFSNQETNFREAYEIAKAFIASRRECWLNAELLHVKAYDLNARVYDYFLKQESIEMMKLQIQLKQAEANQVPEAVNKGMDAILDQISSLQHNSKVDRNKSKIDM